MCTVFLMTTSRKSWMQASEISKAHEASKIQFFASSHFHFRKLPNEATPEMFPADIRQGPFVREGFGEVLSVAVVAGKHPSSNGCK
jgi:hypothetical protein